MLFTTTTIFELVFTLAPQNVMADSPCPTGVYEVTRSWWAPSNNKLFTMCGCDTVSGYDSSGSCSGGGTLEP